jgi:hypothetical protein
MLKFYAVIQGQSKENNINSPIDFWQVVFNLDKKEAERGVKLGFNKAMVKQGKNEYDTIKKFEEMGYMVKWQDTPYNYRAYVVKDIEKEISEMEKGIAREEQKTIESED